MKNLSLILTAALFALSACSRNLDSSTYTSGSTVGKVVYGTVISARPVTVKEHDKLEDNGVGGLAGGLAGGVAGSTIGRGNGSTLAAIGGALAGAVIGAEVQDQLGTNTGTEYIVQLDGAQKTNSHTSKRDYRITGGNSVSGDINNSIQVDDQATSAISVVQQDQVMIAPGSRVAVIYSDDRPRIAPLR